MATLPNNCMGFIVLFWSYGQLAHWPRSHTTGISNVVLSTNHGQPSQTTGIYILTTNHGQPSQITGIFNELSANARGSICIITLKETEFGVGGSCFDIETKNSKRNVSFLQNTSLHNFLMS